MSDDVEKLTSKNWPERIAALERIDQRLRSQLCSVNEATSLIFAVIDVLSKDKHANLVVAAANTLARAGDYLSQQFAPFAKPLINVCLAGFQCSKPAVANALRSAADATLPTLPLDTLIDVVSTSLMASNPNILMETASFLQRGLCYHYKKVSGNSIAALPVPVRRGLVFRLAPPLVALLDAQRPGVRDAGYSALGYIRLFAAPDEAFFVSAAGGCFSKLDDSKQTRIKQEYGRAKQEVATSVLSPRGSDKFSNRSSPPAVNSMARTKNPPGKQPVSDTIDKQKLTKSETSATRSKRPLTSNVSSASRRPCLANDKPPSDQTRSLFASEQILNDEEFTSHLLKYTSELVLTQVKSGVWRERLAGLDVICGFLPSLKFSPAFVQTLITWLLVPPGLKDNNFQVRCRLLEVIGLITSSAKPSSLSEPLYESLISSIGGLLNDPKCVAACGSCLCRLANAVSLRRVTESLLRLSCSLKSPKAIINLIEWLLSQAFKADFTVNRTLAFECIQSGLGANSGEVRQAFIQLTGAIYLSMERDSSFRAQFASCRPLILSQLEAEFDRRDKAILKQHEVEEHSGICGYQQGDLLAEYADNPPSGIKRVASSPPVASPPIPTHRPAINLLEAPVICHSSRALNTSYALSHDSPDPAHETFKVTEFSSPLLKANNLAKQARLRELENGRLSRAKLELLFHDAGMHPNLVRQLVAWDNPHQLEQALSNLINLLLQETPRRTGRQLTREEVAVCQTSTDGLTETLANTDLIFNWIAEACFSRTPGDLNAQLFDKAFDYLEELVARVCDAKLSLTQRELALLLPWPLFSPDVCLFIVMGDLDRARRMTSFVRSLCTVFPPKFVFPALMEGVATLTDPRLIQQLLQLAANLLSRFSSVLRPSMPEIKAFVQQIGSAHRDVRREAIECCRAVKAIYPPEQVIILAGQLNEKDRILLEDCLKERIPLTLCDASPYVSTECFTTPKRLPAQGDQYFSQTNCPSLLASVSCSYLTQPPHLDADATDAEIDSDEMVVLAARKWILNLLKNGVTADLDNMVENLITGLLTEAPTHERQLDDALLSISHLEFLHQAVATRDLLLPRANDIIRCLGIQMSLYSLGAVPQFSLKSEDVAVFIRTTCCSAMSFFRGSFITRDLSADSLSYLIAGLIRLHSVFCRLGSSIFGVGTSCLLLVQALDRARALRDNIFIVLQYIHGILNKDSTATYVESLCRLLDPTWSGYRIQGELDDPLIDSDFSLLELLKKAIDRVESSEFSQKEDLSKVILAIGGLYPFCIDDLQLPEAEADFRYSVIRQGLNLVAHSAWRICCSHQHIVHDLSESMPKSTPQMEEFFAWMQTICSFPASS